TAPPLSPPPPTSPVDQCTSTSDCTDGRQCVDSDGCFRACSGSVCNSGCTGVCRGNDGHCGKTSMPAASGCPGAWSIAITREGCPEQPTCLCPDGTALPASGKCATTCSCAPARCGSGQAVVYRNGCCASCATACVVDDDCENGQRCLRQGACALVVCP